MKRMTTESMEEEEPQKSMSEPMLDWILNGIPQKVSVKLFDDVGFIYEAQLAKMELSSWWSELDAFRARAAYFEEVNGQKTNHYFISDIKGKGQIGRTCQYLTHWFYPYKAKFHPQMIKALINWMGIKNKDRLLDPFVGSGTALIEAKTLGIDSWGVDINPVCTLMSRVKCKLLDFTPEDLKIVSKEEAFNFFDKKYRRSPTRLFSHFEQLAAATEEANKLVPDKDLHDFYKLCYLYALSDYTYIKREMWEGFSENFDDIFHTVEKFHGLKQKLDIKLGNVEVLEGDARRLSQIFPRNYFAGIVTSPPYSIAVDYIKNDLHALEYLNVDARTLVKDMIGLRGNGATRIANYYNDMMVSFKEMNKVLQLGKYCVVLIGDITFNGKRLPIHQRYIEFAESAGFICEKNIRRPILGGFARLRYEYILVFKKMREVSSELGE